MAKTVVASVADMPLDKLYLERVGLELWSNVLGDLSPEETQMRIETLDAEIERRESPPPVEGEAASEAEPFPF